jgi:SAM-dependent methyltransferase
MKLFQKNDYRPDVFHPYYFIRHMLLAEIKKNTTQLNGRILDFGCGSKPYMALFNYTEYIGLDFENEGHPHDHEVIDVFYDGKNIPFADEHFDSVLSTEVFEHVFSLDETLRELNRVLKPGGKMLFTCPFVWNEHEVPYDYARYTRFALAHLLQKNGFEVISHGKSGHFICTIHQLLNLYFFRKLASSICRFWLTNWMYKLLLVMPINVGGIVASFVLPKDKTLYLNNVVVAQKTKLP